MSDEQFREDELVSAYLDGEATPAEIAEVEQNDALMAQVEQLRSVRDALAAPVAPMPAERREQMISAALAVADAENAQRREARIVPVQRRRETLLAVAAAAILLAAVVSAGLIASRGDDESAEMAADAPAADAGVEATAAAPAEADMAMADDSADYEMAAEPMPEEEPMAEQEPMAEEALAATAAEAEGAVDPEVVAELQMQLEAAEAEAEAEEAAMAQPAEEVAGTPTASADEADREAEEERRAADDATRQVVDLGAFASLESLFDDIAASWSAALEDGTTTDSGTCSAAVHEWELDLDIETGRPFVATVGAENPLVFDGRFTRRDDGTAVIVYAAPPSCEIGTHDLDAPDGS
ncbi:MAG: hypothetical protein F4Y05_01875 [Acidimicrobiaceae bacterium]|nr:hypothetical protein [Acidimicrobiaceae bacterium]MYE08334.1 hypothetical protein [Acidimicrobiaceae bacterium]MYI35312.1 hypothetical protein [Acidimicrobiaceae bacterium]